MRSLSPVVMVGVLCCALGVQAASPPKLIEARKLIDDLELEAALKALDAADKTEGNDRAAVLEIYLLQGVAFGTLGKDAKTRDSFRKLLMLDPQAALPADQPPRVKTPFFEAKEWVATNGPLLAVPDARIADGKVEVIAITVQKDVLRLARGVRFHLKTGGPEEVMDVAVTNGKAELAVGKPAVRWWAELISDRKATLAEVISAGSPREDLAPGAAAIASDEGPLKVETVAPVSGGWRRPTGLVLIGAGVVAAGVGALFGVQSATARNTLTTAPVDEQGRVTGLTQRDAGSLEAQANSQATLANVLFVAGGALGVAGVVLAIVGPDAAPTVALSPAPGGVLVHGSF